MAEKRTPMARGYVDEDHISRCECGEPATHIASLPGAMTFYWCEKCHVGQGVTMSSGYPNGEISWVATPQRFRETGPIPLQDTPRAALRRIYATGLRVCGKCAKPAKWQLGYGEGQRCQACMNVHGVIDPGPFGEGAPTQIVQPPAVVIAAEALGIDLERQ